MITYKKYGKTVNSELVDKILDSSHVLISGTTGSGKSVLIDEIMFTILCNFTPLDYRFVLIDPKMVSLSKYIQTPFCDLYADNNEDILNALDYCIDLMMKRYSKMKDNNQTSYDGSAIYIVIDELADLMTTCKNDFMPKLQRILQLGRASKIFVIAATQEPSRTIIPSALTVNFNCRVGLHCNDSIESKQIIKKKGCEELPQYGECLLFHKDGKYYHSKVDMIFDNDIKQAIKFWNEQNIKPINKSNKKIDKHALRLSFLQLIGALLGSFFLIKFILFIFSAYS